MSILRTLAVSGVFLGIQLFCAEAEAPKKEDVEALIKEFIRLNNFEGALILDDIEAMEKLLADDCKIEWSSDGKKGDVTRGEFARMPGKMKFMEKVRQVWLKDPQYKFEKERATVATSVLLRSAKDDMVMNYQLVIKLAKGRAALTRIDYEVRKPTAEELAAAEKMLKP